MHEEININMTVSVDMHVEQWSNRNFWPGKFVNCAHKKLLLSWILLTSSTTKKLHQLNELKIEAYDIVKEVVDSTRRLEEVAESGTLKNN